MALQAEKSPVSFCWLCSRRLYGGGRFYEWYTDESGHSHPVHKQCLDREEQADPRYPESTDDEVLW